MEELLDTFLFTNNPIPEKVLGIRREELTTAATASLAMKKLFNIIENKDVPISNRKLACAYFSRLVGEATEEIRIRFISALIVLMTDPNFTDKYTFFFSYSEYKFNSFITQALHEYYFKTFPEPLIYRILSAGYLLEYKKVSDDFRSSLEEYLITMARTKSINESIRAECADILKRVGSSPEVREIGDEVINELGNVKVRGLDTVYMNKQNAHSKDVMESALLTLQKISTTEYKTNSLTDIKNELLSTLKDEKDERQEKIEKVLSRMFIDPARFDGYTLSTILYIVWDRIQRLPELKKRLCEEILEMDETCSSGYFTRMMNIFTGTEYGGVKISFENEIRASVFARLGSYLYKFGSEVRDEIVSGIGTCGQGQALVEFIERFSPKDELEEEYKNLLSKEEFDKFYQKAVDSWCGIPPP